MNSLKDYKQYIIAERRVLGFPKFNLMHSIQLTNTAQTEVCILVSNL